MAECKKTITDYMEYRDFLRDYIAQKKHENPSYSMRAFAAKLNCNPGQFNRIIKGERNLLPAHLIEICKIIKLTKKEKRYFELLVSYNHAKKQAERDYFFEQLQQFRKTDIKTVSSNQYLLYSHWYYLVIRELLAIVPCYGTSEKECRRLAKLLSPSISHTEMHEALETLIDLGVIEYKPDGTLGSSESFTASGNEVPQVITNRFLLEFTDLAKRSVDTFSKSQRRLSTLTFSVSSQGFQKISERIDEFRRELLGIVATDEGELDKVYHCNFHLFPVSKTTQEYQK